MPLMLSSSDVKRFQNALTALLSPLDYPSTLQWSAALMRAGQELLGADLALFGARLGDELVVGGSDPNADAAVRPYMDYFIGVDEPLMRSRLAKGLEAYSLEMLTNVAEYRQSELYCDWASPHRLHDTLGMSLDLGTDLPAILHFYHHTDGGRSFGKHGVEMLHLLLPAFKAGIQTQLRLAGHRTQLARVIDQLPQAVLVYDEDGKLRLQNVRATDLLRGEPQAAILLGAANRLALGVRYTSGMGSRKAAGDPVAQPRLLELHTGAGKYRMWASRLGHGMLAPGPSILVAFERVQTPPLSDAELRARFRLTPRECEVARLLSAGRTNREIAVRLRIRERTAEHHTEHVLLRLEVRTRAAVGAVLRVSVWVMSPVPRQHCARTSSSGIPQVAQDVLLEPARP